MKGAIAMKHLAWILGVFVLVVQPPAGAATWRLSDVTSGTGLAATQESWTANPIDYNNDGRDDIWIGYHDNGGKLWQNNGDGTMTWVARSAWPVRGLRSPDGVRRRIDRHGCTWADVDLNGLVDSYCAVGRTGHNRVKDAMTDNELWLQTSLGSFTDVGTELGVGDPYGRGRNAILFDATMDGRPDLYVLNEIPRSGDSDGKLYGANKLFVNVADPGAPLGFRLDPAPNWGLDRHLGFGSTALTFDADNDGRNDLLLTGRGRPYLFLNTGTSFSDESSRFGLPGRHVMAMARADIDGDGVVDLVEVRATAVEWQRNLGSSFGSPRVIRSLSDGWEVAVADADGDSLQDVYVLQSAATWNPTDYLMLNRRGSWVSVPAPSMDGEGSDVEPLTLRVDQLAHFVVLNGGRDLPGPVKVLQLAAG